MLSTKKSTNTYPETGNAGSFHQIKFTAMKFIEDV